MSLESKISKNVFQGNGTTKTFSFTFRVWKEDQVLVYVGIGDETETDVTSTCTITLSENGGTVTFPTAPAVGMTVVIMRNMPFTQEDQYITGARFDPHEIEDRLDQDCAERQQLLDGVERAVKVPVTSDKKPGDYMAAFWKAVADVLKSVGIVESAEDYIRRFVAGIPIIKSNLSEVEAGADGLYWVTGFGNAGKPGHDISNRLVVADGSTEARTLGERAADIINVRDFGAKGDGVTDDTEAIQKAFDAGKGNTVFIPRGVYNISETVYVSPSTSVIGAGEYDSWDLSDEITNGVIFHGIGSGTRRIWTDIAAGEDGVSPAGDAPISVMMVLNGNSIKTRNLSFTSDGWDVAVFTPCCRQIGAENCYTNQSFAVAGWYIDATWSTRNQYLHNLHTDRKINASAGATEHTYMDCFFQASDTGIGLKVRGTDRKIDCVDSDDDWLWGWGGTSDMRIISSRLHGIQLSGNRYQNYNSKIQLIGCSFRVTEGQAINGIGADFRQTSNITLVGCYSEVSNSDSVKFPIHLSKTTTNIFRVIGSYLIGTVWYDGENTESELESVELPERSAVVFNRQNLISTDDYIVSGSIRPRIPYQRNIGTGEYPYKNVSCTGINLHGESLESDVLEDLIRIYNNSGVLKIGIRNKVLIQNNSDNSLLLDITSKDLYENSTIRYNATLRPATDNTYSLGNSSYRYTQVYAASGSINTSDANEKQSIEAYPDAVLDAWGEVEFRQFLFKDAVEKKGDAARIHSGVIAQQVVEAFKKHGVEATKYGLLCYDEWDDEYENVEVEDSPAVLDADGNEVTPAQTHREQRCVVEAGSRYGIRYSEALCLEAAYQRRRAERIEQRLANLEALMTMRG